MLPTVRQILEYAPLRAGRPHVIGGVSGLDEQVRWVHASDADDLRGLLQGGEMVLTTGPALTSLEVVRDYLAQLAELGVKALVVELGTHVDELPHATTRWADEHMLPVIVLEERIRFVDVTEHVHRAIVADQYEEVRFARSVHESFTVLNINRATPTDIVVRASEIIGVPIVLEDNLRRVLAFCPAGGDTGSLLRGWSARSSRRAEPDGAGWLATPVGVRGRGWGRLVLPSVVSDDGRARVVLERAAQSLELQRMVEEDREALLAQASGGLLDDLLADRTRGEEEAAARASALGVVLGRAYVPFVLVTGNPLPGDVLQDGTSQRRLLGSLKQSVAAVGLSGLASGRRDGTVAALLSCPSSASATEGLERVALDLRQRLRDRNNHDTWVIGAAPAASTFTGAVAHLAEATHVAKVAFGLPDDRRVFRAADVRLRGLLTILAGDDRVQQFADAELGRLLAHDLTAGDDLLGLLRAFLESGGSKTSAASTLGLSRPTLYARLAQVERLLGVSLETADSRTSLHAALMIVDARSGQSAS